MKNAYLRLAAVSVCLLATAAFAQETSSPDNAKVRTGQAAFTNYQQEKPGVSRKITLADLPQPYATPSANNDAQIVPRPGNVWPKTIPGFKVEQYATDLNNPRLILTAPNGDLFVAESKPGDIRVFRGMTKEGKPEKSEVFATGLDMPFGIAFYPPGPSPKWIYVGNTGSVVRFPYHSGDMKATGPSQMIVPGIPPGGHLRGGGHWTRDVAFSPDGKTMFVSVGSHSNHDDADTHPQERHRADILAYTPAGKDFRIYAYGIRNPVGIAIDPSTGQLWTSVNERDTLGNNLVPDYITHVQKGGFYGWPWFYMGGHWDPTLKGKHPELKDKVITPDVLVQPHSASLELTFYQRQPVPGTVPRRHFRSRAWLLEQKDAWRLRGGAGTAQKRPCVRRL